LEEPVEIEMNLLKRFPMKQEPGDGGWESVSIGAAKNELLQGCLSSVVLHDLEGNSSSGAQQQHRLWRLVDYMPNSLRLVYTHPNERMAKVASTMYFWWSQEWGPTENRWMELTPGTGEAKMPQRLRANFRTSDSASNVRVMVKAEASAPDDADKTAAFCELTADRWSLLIEYRMIDVTMSNFLITVKIFPPPATLSRHVSRKDDNWWQLKPPVVIFTLETGDTSNDSNCVGEINPPILSASTFIRPGESAATIRKKKQTGPNICHYGFHQLDVKVEAFEGTLPLPIFRMPRAAQLAYNMERLTELQKLNEKTTQRWKSSRQPEPVGSLFNSLTWEYAGETASAMPVEMCYNDYTSVVERAFTSEETRSFMLYNEDRRCRTKPPAPTWAFAMEIMHRANLAMERTAQLISAGIQPPHADPDQQNCQQTVIYSS
jgi:hypothetical protein